MGFRWFGRNRLKERINALERHVGEARQAQEAEARAFQAALEAQQAILHAQQTTIHAQQSALQPLQATVEALRAALETQQTAVQALQSTVQTERATTVALQAALQALQASLESQRADMDKRTEVTGHLIQDLQTRLASEEAKRLEWERLFMRSFGPGNRRPAKAETQLANPCVSVILATWNRGRFLAESIASVQAQSMRNWELIIVDDGSTDDTASAVAPFLEDQRIRYISQEHAGPSAARNRGLRESSAPFVAYIDSDNVWFPEFLASAVESLAAEPDVDLVYGALVTEQHQLPQSQILWEPFSRERLLRGNCIDTNVLVHRRTLVDRFGGWDENLGRLLDWDLVLRYTSEKPARRLEAMAAYSRERDAHRITTTIPAGPSLLAILGKWFPPPSHRRPRVLYAVWHYPQLSESYVEAEIACMRRWGVHVEVWRSEPGVATYPTDIPIHDGPLENAIEASRPDIVHVHWLSFAHSQTAALAASGIPVTLRLHGFDVTRESLAAWLRQSWVKGVYAFPNQITHCGIRDPRLKPTPAAFDTTLFAPSQQKDRRMVLRASSALASKDLELFLQTARELPEYRFVLATVTCRHREDYVEHLKTAREQMGSPAELLCDVPREQMADLMSRAGIYVHTLCPPGAENATPLGQPSSVAEAMATGCYCLVRDVPDLADFVGEAGATYRDLDQLVERIRATSHWTDAEWRKAEHRAVDRAHFHHADVVVFREIFRDWMKLLDKPAQGS
jgi:glycosyltransferase involved in cell wall biosynthesis